MHSHSKFYLYKRSNGFYYIGHFIDGRLKWKSTGTTRKANALKELSQFRELLKARPKTITLSVFTTDFLDYSKVNYAKPTVDIARIALRHLRNVAGDCLLSMLTPQHLDRYKVMRLSNTDEPVSPVTVNVELRSLRAIMNVALRWKLIEGNPFACVQLMSVPDRPHAYLNKEDFQELLDLIKENWLREVLLFAVLTGMRRGEIVNLRWKDVDLSRKLLQVQSNPTFKTKQGKRRTVPLNEVAYHMLTARANRAESEYVLAFSGRKIAQSWLSHRFKDYVRKAGLCEGLHFHSLRHTFASWLVQDGVSLYEVQRLLGHSSIAVTQVYSHLQPEQLHETVNRLKIALN